MTGNGRYAGAGDRIKGRGKAQKAVLGLFLKKVEQGRRNQAKGGYQESRYLRSDHVFLFHRNANLRETTPLTKASYRWISVLFALHSLSYFLHGQPARCESLDHSKAGL
jgi:hypothetical protein